MKPLTGNEPQFDLTSVHLNSGSLLIGKKILFLGSSVTAGFAANNISVVDFLAAQDGVLADKEAVSGTTLAGYSPDTYVHRLKSQVVPQRSFDAVVCQLSTNDASARMPIGKIASDDHFDIETVSGALETIASYVERTWRCPLIIYTNPKYDSDFYARMVVLLYQLSNRWTLNIIDLWNDVEFNQTLQSKSYFMADSIHPTKAGYLEVWTPKFRQALIEWI